MKYWIIILIFFFEFLSNAGNVSAIVDPRESHNNIYGIHILDVNDLEGAAQLVNSSGGDWGYVTLVIRKDERNIKHWQSTFDKMRKLHLIPIVRIASKMSENSWEKLSEDDIDNWIYFLNSLNWVIQNRYVVVGNEPNHATEWGGEVKPQEYARYLSSFSKKLKDASADFFILPAGFDASAPSDKSHMDEADFLKTMIAENSDIFNSIDGWTSHSYPNPDFSGSVEDNGRGSIKTFEWEINLLKNIGVKKELPIFITETGWAHNMDILKQHIKTESISDNFRYAFQNIWSKNNIIAVTPFLLNYQNPPFDVFSWKKIDGSYYGFYYDVQKVKKIKGDPAQINSGQILAVLTPKVVVRDDRFYGLAYVKNTGQKIWKSGEVVLIKNNDQDIEIESPFFIDIEPGQKGFILFSVTANTKSVDVKGSISLAFKDKVITNPYVFSIKINPV